MNKEVSRGRMEEEIYRVLNQVSNFIHEHYQEELQEAFEYFWEEERPEDILQGVMLDMGELNFDDWLTIDYRNPYGQGFLELYERYSEPEQRERMIIKALKESTISLYEVEGTEEGRIRLRDLLRNIILYPEWQHLPVAQLREGDLFAARFIQLGDRFFMGKCLYPFHRSLKEKLLKYIDMQYKRYIKNENPRGDMNTFLKDASSVFNTIWLTVLGDKG